jgi:CubicO group peptidase (beta-lactamase class C family)
MTDVFASLPEFVEQSMVAWNVPGVAVGIVHNGDAVLARGFGVKRTGGDDSVGVSTLFPIASVTKSFTATAMATLVDAGVVDWDTPAREIDPTFELYDPVATLRVTPRDLLSHRTGVPTHNGVWFNRDTTRAELFATLKHLPPSADLRTVYQYSNLMYMAAGHLMEVVTGLSWEEIVRARILDALCMRRTNFSIAHSKNEDDIALGHVANPEGVSSVAYYERQNAIAPCGAMVSTVEELIPWLRLQLDEGISDGQRLVSRQQMRELHTVQILYGSDGRYPELGGARSGYGMGWGIDDYRGYTMVNHGGGITGFTSYAAFIPSLKVGVIALCNASGPNMFFTQTIAYNVFDRVLEMDELPWRERYLRDQRQVLAGAARACERTEESRIAGTSPSHALYSYAGHYAHPAYGVIECRLTDDALLAVFNDRWFALKHRHYDVFVMTGFDGEDFIAKFGTTVFGDVGLLEIPLEPTTDPIVFTRVAVETSGVDGLAALAGTYLLESGDSAVIRQRDGACISAVLPGLERRDIQLIPLGDGDYALRGVDPSRFFVSFILAEEDEREPTIVCLVNGAAFAGERVEEIRRDLPARHENQRV